MREFFSQFVELVLSPVRIVTVFAAAILLGITGPFGTYLILSLPERLAYWSTVVLVSTAVVLGIKVLVDMNFLGLAQWKKALVVAVAMTIVLAPMLKYLTDAVIGDAPKDATPLWVFASLTFSIMLLVVFVQYLLGYRAFRSPPRLYARFSDPEADGILWITVRDHYVDVYTNRGKETLLMRFSDALAELDGMAGLQIHRSHWVASGAVVDLKKQNGRSVVVLQDGTEVPVSRGYLEAANLKFS